MWDGVWAGVAVDPPVVRWGFSMAVLRTALELNNLVVKASGRRIRWRCRSITASRFLPRNFSFYFAPNDVRDFVTFPKGSGAKVGVTCDPFFCCWLFCRLFQKLSMRNAPVLTRNAGSHTLLIVHHLLPFLGRFFQISEIEFFTLQLFEKMAIKCHAWWPRCPPISIHLNVDPSSM